MSNSMKTMDLKIFIEAIEGGTKLIGIEQNHINDLNVFPVPDGDTGSNMNSTVAGALDIIKNAKIDNFKQFAKIYSKGLLLNARGNSGVIFSQIMRGFTNSFSDINDELTPADIVNCFLNAKEKAYSSVANPIEGTILTVIRLTSEALKNHDNFETINDVFNYANDECKKALDKTPEMLAELKKVGVVDSGGYGLMTFIKGMTAVINGDLDNIVADVNSDLISDNSKNKKADLTSFINPDENKGFGYCSEIILSLGDKMKPELKKTIFGLDKFELFLKKIGNSVVLVQDENIVKVHVHTLTPYKLLQEAQKYGEFVKIKIENMNDQFYSQAQKQGIDIKNIANLNDDISIIVTLPSYKLKKYFNENLDIKHVIVTEDDGNPSIQTILSKVVETKSKNVILIVDDSNYVLAAKEVVKLVARKIKLQIIASNNAFETSLVLSTFESTNDLKNDVKILNNSLKNVISGKVSISVKDIANEHVIIKKDDYIGIVKKDIIVDEPIRFECVKKLINYLITSNKIKDTSEWICHLICGKNIDASEPLMIEKYINEQYGIACEIIEGDQPTYDYLIGLESY